MSRHPLHEQVVDTFVANDLYIVGGRGLSRRGGGGDVCESDQMEVEGQDETNEYEMSSQEDETGSMRKEKSIVICTGANACGKSVYLKQVCCRIFVVD